jgi:hypothetical protein
MKKFVKEGKKYESFDEDLKKQIKPKITKKTKRFLKKPKKPI